jgi:hypothetical protein
LPETEDFLKADLRRDPAADLAKAEGEKNEHTRDKAQPANRGGITGEEFGGARR